jgi:dihydropteroate synthase
MQLAPTYGDVVAEVSAYLQTRLQAAADLGIAGVRVVLDPGIGFGKTSEHNRLLLARLGELGRLGRPVLLGVSRKGFLGRMLNDRPVTERLAASLACACDAVIRRTARIIRVHDVAASRDAVEVIAAIERGRTDVVGPPDAAV